MGVCEFHHEFCVHDIRPRAKHLAVQLHHFCQHEQGHSINVRAHLPKPHLVMHSGVCEARSADGKTLRGSVMSMKFMKEFTGSRSKLRKFPLSLSQFKRDRKPNLQSKLTSLQKLTILVQQLCGTQLFCPSRSNP